MQRKQIIGLAASLGVVAGVLLTGCSSNAQPSAATPSETQSSAPASPDDTTASTDPTEAAPDPSESAEPSAAPSATPAPSPSRDASGGVENGLEPAPPATRETLPPEPIGKPAVPEQGVTMNITSHRAVDIPAGEPGEIAGPGVAFEMAITNNSSEAMDLSNVIADLRYGADEAPATTTGRAPTVPFKGSLAPGQTATGTYAFRLDDAQRNEVVIYVSLNGETPLIAFRGSAK